MTIWRLIPETSDAFLEEDLFSISSGEDSFILLRARHP
jgi:hypothetical protein